MKKNLLAVALLLITGILSANAFIAHIHTNVNQNVILQKEKSASAANDVLVQKYDRKDLSTAD